MPKKFCWTCTWCYTLIVVGTVGEIWCLWHLF